MLVFWIELCMSKYLNVEKPRMAQRKATIDVFDLEQSICSKSRVNTYYSIKKLDP